MNKLNHLKTYESFTTNEEFNPLKKQDWKDTGNYLRKGMGFLNDEEKIEKAEEMILSHPVRSQIYKKFLREDPLKAEEYVIFWSENEEGANPVWDEINNKFEDKAYYSYNTGPGGIGR
jgi:hypothetical protein